MDPGSSTSVATMATSNESQKKPVSWRHLMYEFTQDTTLHGIKYTTAPTPFAIRRVVWTFLVLGAISFFSWFLAERLMYLNASPKTVDVEVIYTDSVEFPAVTICNQNLFRMSATSELALYDVVEESFREILGSSVSDGFDAHVDKYLWGDTEPHDVYVNITAQVCKQLCEDIHSDSCCSLTYDRETRVCEISPLEHEADGVELKYKPYTDYYKRIKCQVQRNMMCEFENSTICHFVADFTKTVEWRWSGEIQPADALLPQRDHSLVSTRGNIMYAATKFPSPNDVAHLISPYILSDDNTCLKFFYWINSGVLNVKMSHQTEGVVILWNRGADDIQQWQKGYFKLPSGYYRLIFEAISSEAADGLKIAIDDIDISGCRAQTCTETVTGSGYTSTQSSPSKNRNPPCLRWDAIAPYTYQTVWRYQNKSLTEKLIKDEENYCRNPDSDPGGLWCFVGQAIDTTTMMYCDVPQCGCRDVEFTCDNGRCVSRDLLCDFNDDCGDNSDEMKYCNRTASVECGFDGSWMCGYSTPQDFKRFPWKTQADYLTLDVDGENAQDGLISQLESPVFVIEEESCLHVDYIVEGEVTLDIIIMDDIDKSSTLLCSLPHVNQTINGWNSTDMMLSPGVYRLLLEVVVSAAERYRFRLDDITLLNENCTFNEEPIMTTEEPMYTWQFDNSTWDNWTVTEVTTEGGTTESYTTATPEIDLGPHPPFVHRQCVPRKGQPASYEKRLSDQECVRTFKQYAAPALGVSSNCPRIDGGFGYTLDRCKRETADFGGNVFNYRNPGECYMHRCEDTAELQLTTTQGGWYVYTLEYSEEPSGIQCSFLAPCACGYNFTTSNIKYRMLRKDERIDRITDGNITINETEHFVSVGLAEGVRQPVEGRNYLRLVSPPVHEQDRTHDHCLHFNYRIGFVNITVYREDIGNDNRPVDRTMILRIERDGQREVWHRATASMPKGLYRVIFEVEFEVQQGKLPLENFGIDNVKLERGLCTVAEEGPLDCDFEDLEYCRYRDHSPGPFKWVRSRNNNVEGSVPGVYYMRTSGHFRKKDTAVLKSPFYTFTDVTCLDFYYFMQGWDNEGLITLSLSRELANGTEIVEWVVRAITDNGWHRAQTSFFSSQPFRLVFRLTGKHIRAGVDHIVVSNTTCLLFNCSKPSEHLCASHGMACIPGLNECDNVANCAMGEDEFQCQANFSVPENENSTVPFGEDEESNNDNHNKMKHRTIDPIGSALSLTEIYMQAGHQLDDFLYKCKFEGKSCNKSFDFKKQVTDYGVCYTFNSNEKHTLKTAKTGSRFGLSLTINIEQYEYMMGPQSDAGIKVFLHPTVELPQVRDLGFAVPPGSHSLVGVRLNEAINLPPPHGECGSKKLEYYQYYTYSLCQRECETIDVVKECQCRDAYMPGKTEDYPEVCDLATYFGCAIQTINGVAVKTPCHCPKPCNQTIYEPSLSAADLSFLSVDNILSDKSELDLITNNYHRALEARQRVSKQGFADDIELISSITKIFTDMRRTAKTYLGDFQRSFFTKVWISSTALAMEGFTNDINYLFEHMELYKDYYETNYQKYVENVQGDLLEESLRVLYQDLDSIIKGYAPKNRGYFERRLMDSMVDVNLTRSRLMILDSRLTDSSSVEEPSETNGIKVQPETFNVQLDSCQAIRTTIIRNLKSMENGFKRIIESQTDDGDYNHTLLAISQRNIERHHTKYTQLHRCLEEYPQALDRVLQWKEDALQDARSQFHGEPFDNILFDYDENVEPLIQDEDNLMNLLMNYSYGRIEKLEYLKTYAKEEHGTVLESMTDFIENIESDIITPLKRRLDGMQELLYKYYIEALEQATEFERYLRPDTFYNSAKLMVILTHPEANLESGALIIGPLNFWQSWKQEEKIATFTREKAPSVMRQALSDYLGILNERVIGVEDQFVEKKENLNQILEKINDKYKKYIEKRKIDHKFILSSSFLSSSRPFGYKKSYQMVQETGENFLNMDVYFAQLKHQQVKQLKAYEITQFFGDVGGFMGLLLGASALTVCELIDLVIFNFAKKIRSQKTHAKGDKLKIDELAMKCGDVRENLYAPDAPNSVNVTENPLNGVMDYGFSNNHVPQT